MELFLLFQVRQHQIVQNKHYVLLSEEIVVDLHNCHTHIKNLTYTELTSGKGELIKFDTEFVYY
jgi:hypothetical protein